jgi:SAM-dependent methyltransferase
LAHIGKRFVTIELLVPRAVHPLISTAEVAMTEGMTKDVDWRATNHALWEERTAIHLGPGGYDLGLLRAGAAPLDRIVDAELGSVEGLRVLHLQCHFGRDTLALAQRGADVTGLDFSGAAITAARGLASELGLGGRARFIESDVHTARQALPQPDAFDLVFVSWGALCWLPDIIGWARIVAFYLRPGVRLYLAEAHPAAYVFDDQAPTNDPAKPGWLAPYFETGVIETEETEDYANRTAKLVHTRVLSWMHPLAAVISALRGAGLALDWLHEHPRVTWQMFRCLVQDAEGLWTWPDRPWLPLSYSLSALRTPPVIP